MNLPLKLFLLLFGSLLTLFGIMIFRAEIYYPKPAPVDWCNVTHKPIEGQEIVDRFSQALRFKTVTSGTGNYDRVELKRFGDFIRKSFPTIHSSKLVTHLAINNLSLLYSIHGSDQSLKPYLLMSHLDVVPVERSKWDVDPFSGIIKDDHIYGRGAIDVKNTLMASLEALEYALVNGFKPKRSFFLAFGHDEEGLGADGAGEIVKYLSSQGIKELEYVLDEGMMMFHDIIPGMGSNQLVAVVGVTEKGYVSVKVKAEGNPGHSSMSPENTAITTLGRAIGKLTGSSQPNFFGSGPERAMYEVLARHSTYPAKLLYSNLWFFGPILSKIMSSDPSLNALVRTTTAVTMVSGGFKENVLPTEAHAIVNHRIHPLQTVADVIAHDHKVVNDPSISIEPIDSYHEPFPISPHGERDFGYQTIKQSVEQIFDQAVVVPGILVATTDSRFYFKFTNRIYRFSPTVMKSKEDLKRYHGHNERISIKNYLETVNFFHHIILNSDKPILDRPKFVKDEL